MRTVAIACVKNEIDIVEPFVRHTVAIVDRLVILDNGSQDGTLDVLNALRDEGLSLDIVEDPSPGQYQSQRMTRLMREWAIGRHAADWVLALDGDEFLVLPPGDSLLPDAIAGDQPVSLPWRTYVADPGDDAEELNPLLRIRRRRVADAWEAVKLMTPRALAELPDAKLAQGSHQLFLDGHSCPPRPHPTAYLAHFPLRSAGQYAAKIAINSLQHQTMAERNWQWATHYNEPFDLLKRDPRAFAASFTAVSLHYALPPNANREPTTVIEPVDYRGGPLRYTPRIDDLAYACRAILSYAEDLATRHSVLAGSLSESEQLAMCQQATIVAGLRDQLGDQQKHLTFWVESAAAEREAAARLDMQLMECTKQLAAATTELAHMKQAWPWKVGRLLRSSAAHAVRALRKCRRALTESRSEGSSRCEH